MTDSNTITDDEIDASVIFLWKSQLVRKMVCLIYTASQFFGYFFFFCFFSCKGRRQINIANITGVTQGAVSKILKRTRGRGDLAEDDGN